MPKAAADTVLISFCSLWVQNAYFKKSDFEFEFTMGNVTCLVKQLVLKRKTAAVSKAPKNEQKHSVNFWCPGIICQKFFSLEFIEFW